MSTPRTLFDKIWRSHIVDRQDDGTCLIYIDRHLVHEVTSPQAFEGLRLAGRAMRRPDLTLAVADHNVPTSNRAQGIADPESALQVETLADNCAAFGVEFIGMDDPRQASSTSSGRSWASPCRARPSSAATATPPPTAPSARSPSVSAPRRWSTCWRPRP